MENGEPAVLAGKNGIEIAVNIVLETTGKLLCNDPQQNFERSREYWIGWAICYYHWYSGKSFDDIFKVLPFADLQIMYDTLSMKPISQNSSRS